MDSQDLPGAGCPLEARLHLRRHGRTRSSRSAGAISARRCASLPRPAPAERDAGILREWRIIEALTGTDVPITDAIAVCADTSVLGRPFYLMDLVDGWSVMSTRGGGRLRSTPISTPAPGWLTS